MPVKPPREHKKRRQAMSLPSQKQQICVGQYAALLRKRAPGRFIPRLLSILEK
jgi:hypothetical protein